MILPAHEPQSIASLVRLLAAGGVAIAPGDTMYGLIGIAPDTEDRLRRIKGRGEDRPFLQLIADASWVDRFSDQSLPPRLRRFWPGPLTVVMPRRAGGSVALRVPDHPLLQALLGGLGRPLYSTSVNRAGSPPLETVAEIRRQFEADVDAIFDAGDQPPGLPSTLLDITRQPWTILRKGAIALDPRDLA